MQMKTIMRCHLHPPDWQKCRGLPSLLVGRMDPRPGRKDAPHAGRLGATESHGESPVARPPLCPRVWGGPCGWAGDTNKKLKSNPGTKVRRAHGQGMG